MNERIKLGMSQCTMQLFDINGNQIDSNEMPLFVIHILVALAIISYHSNHFHLIR